MSRTPTVASRKAIGTARPVTAEVAWGLILMAIDGAISARDTPTADHTESRRDNSAMFRLQSVEGPSRD